MIDDTTLRELIAETRRDVSWIRESMEEIKEAIKAHDARISNLESWQHQLIGRAGAVAAAISSAIALLAAYISSGGLR